MERIVDASVLLAVALDEDIKPHLLELTRGVTLVAPASLPWELGNALSAQIKRERLTLEQAQQALRIAQSIPVRLLEVDLEWSLILAARHRIYAYDAYLLACAERRRAPLLTLDGRLRDVARSMFLEVLP